MFSSVKKAGAAFALLWIMSGVLWAQDKAEVLTLYQDAKRLSFDKEWTRAISQFEELLDKYPGNRYEDDAKFWIGYCLEKLPGKKQQAFDVYSQLIINYPQSPWVDDAQMHQIELAAEFIYEGKQSYKQFLYEKMRKEQPEIQYRAAIVLGRIGDKKAMPVLEKMKDDEDYGIRPVSGTSLYPLAVDPHQVDRSQENEKGDDPHIPVPERLI